MNIYFLLAVHILFCTTPAMGQSQQRVVKSRAYYISNTGDDTGAGRKNSPWRTIEKMNSITLRAGDSVLFKGGETFHGTLALDSTDEGLRSKSVLISSYGKGQGIIDAGNATAILLEKTKYINVKTLKLSGSGRKNGNTGNGLALVNCSNIVIDGLDISGFRNSGLWVRASSRVRATKIEAHDNGFAGISIAGDYLQKGSCRDIYIGYCNAFNNPGSPAILNNHSGNGIVGGNCSKMTIEYCTATNNGWDMPRKGNGPVGIWCFEADSVVIQHCISYRNKTSEGGDDGGGFDLDGGVTNSVIQYCLSYENQGSGFGLFQYAGASPWHHNIIRYNISENDGNVSAAKAAIYIWNSSYDSLQFTDCDVYNNTIVNNKGAAIHYTGQCQKKGFRFFNNIFAATDSLIKGQPGTDRFLGNNWWNQDGNVNIGGAASLNDWAEQTGNEMLAGRLTGTSMDPQFSINDNSAITSPSKLKFFKKYAIPKQSALRKKGINIRQLFRISNAGFDFNGSPAPVNGVGAAFK